MSKLVIYYSRADENYFGGTLRYISEGNTKRAAKMIAEITGADLFEIEQVTPYSGDYNVCKDQSAADKKNGIRPELVAFPEHMEQYDEIYLGYPNYWGTMPMAVLGLLEKFDWSGKKIYPFCTHEGSGMGISERDIKKACPGAVIEKGLPIHGSEVEHAKALIESWI